MGAFVLQVFNLCLHINLQKCTQHFRCCPTSLNPTKDFRFYAAVLARNLCTLLHIMIMEFYSMFYIFIFNYLRIVYFLVNCSLFTSEASKMTRLSGFKENIIPSRDLSSCRYNISFSD